MHCYCDLNWATALLALLYATPVIKAQLNFILQTADR
jgi:hypothetical protein